MSASPWPHLDAEAAPITHMFKSPRDVFNDIAAKSQDNPELVALAQAVADGLARYEAGALTLRDLARLHTPYQRFRAVRCWGPDSPLFVRMMPVLDELIALHKGQKSPQRPARVGQQDWPIVAATGRHECAACSREQMMTEGRPMLCGMCRSRLGAA